VSDLRVQLNCVTVKWDLQDLYAVIVVDVDGARMEVYDRHDEVVFWTDLDVHTLRAVATAADGERRKKR